MYKQNFVVEYDTKWGKNNFTLRKYVKYKCLLCIM